MPFGNIFLSVGLLITVQGYSSPIEVYFIAGPLLVSAIFSFGLFLVDYRSDPKYLYHAQNSRAIIDQGIQDKHFPQNYSDFDPSRISLHGKYGRLIIQAADGGTILREEVFNQIMYVDQLVRGLTIWSLDHGRNYSYRDVCAHVGNGLCYDNNVLELGRRGLIADIERGRKQLSYPIHLDTDTYDLEGNFMMYVLAFNLGGVELSDDKSIMTGAKAVNLNYFLDSTTGENEKSASSWEMAFQEFMSSNAKRLSGLKIDWYSSLTQEVEFEMSIVPNVVPYCGYEIALMVAFCVMTCMTTDWVKSKPLLGFCSVASAMLGTGTAWGFCLYIGIPFAGVCLTTSFLMLGIGVDDAFMTLAAWQKTDIHKSVPERLALAYADAGASITITSLTDVISFFVGCIVPVPVCRIFCVYIAVSVIFTYLWHITLFGGCLALAGYAETTNRHAIACIKVLPKSLAGDKGFWYSVCCMGGFDKNDPENEKGNHANSSMVFFKESFAPFLNKPTVKTAVLITYTAYALVSGWALTTLRTENDWRRGVRQDSYATAFYDAEEKYFKEFSFRISVIIHEPLDYSNKNVGNDIENLIVELEGHPNIDEFGTESWLREYSDFVKSVEGDPIQKIDISNEQNFNDGLALFLSSGQSVAKDVNIENGTIVASRFMLQAKELSATRPPTDLVRNVREIVDKYPYKIAIYHPNFIYSDLTILLPSLMMQCVAGAAGAMFLVCLIFIPNPLCSLWVTFSIVSIMSGVMGFMSLLGVDLDIITISFVVVCIGLSVDFSAHISYHFMKYQDLSPDERIKETLYTLGLPIVQGATSSCLGVLGLGFVPLYIFQTFMKMVTLAVVIGAVHGIVFLPVFLSLTMGQKKVCQSKKKIQHSHQL